MARVPGVWKAVSLPRRWIAELMAATRDMPIITIEYRMHLADLVAVRHALADPPSWVTVFAKAFAVVARRRPELRRAYMPWPWPHFYETAGTVASIAVERDYGGEPAVFFGQFVEPDEQPLTKLQATLGEWRAAPVEDVRDFRRLLRFMRLPRPVRRLGWWYATKVAGRHRVRQFGTFGISTTASAGATCLNLIAPVPFTLNYGMLADDGSLAVRLHFDHRVIDGMPAARVLTEMEDVLKTTILAELRELSAPPVRAGVRSVEVVVGREQKKR